MPTRFIHSRSFVMPVSVTLPLVQCHHVRGLAESGGVTNPCDSASPVAAPMLCAQTAPVVAAVSTAPAVAITIILFFIGLPFTRNDQTCHSESRTAGRRIPAFISRRL